MLLDATNKSIKIVLGEAIVTKDCDFVAIYADITTTAFTPTAQDGTTNGVTAVTCVSSPASSTQRQVKSLQVYNNDSITHTVIFQYINNTNTRVLYQATVAAGSSLTWSPDTGWVNNSQVAALNITLPDGRLSLASGTPVHTADVTGIGTVYYCQYLGNQLPIWSGTTFITTTFPELNQALTDTTKSPAAATTNSNYDMFIWSDAGTLRLSRGPLWTSNSARGTGGGTTELTRVNGVWVNKNAITNGPGAGFGTYVGTIRTNGSSTCDMKMAPVSAAGGNGNLLSVWNMYNRVGVAASNIDSTTSWAYATAAWREKNATVNSNTPLNHIGFVVGIQEEAFVAVNNCNSLSSSGNIIRYVGIGYDSASAPDAQSATGIASQATLSQGMSAAAYLQKAPAAGYHTIYALEYGNTTSITFFGAPASDVLSILHFFMDM